MQGASTSFCRFASTAMPLIAVPANFALWCSTFQFRGETDLLQTSVQAKIGESAAAVRSEYAQQVLTACTTVNQWVSVSKRNSSVSQDTIDAVNNYVAVEIDLLDRLPRANKKLEEEKKSVTKKDLRDNISKKIQDNEQLIEKIEKTELPVELFDWKFLTDIQTLGGWVDQRKKWIDPKQDATNSEKDRTEATLKNKTLDFIASRFPQEISDLQKIWIQRVKRLITRDTIKSLRPGSTPHFSLPPSYGLRSRGTVFENLGDVLKEFHIGTNEACPLIEITNLPRQGKTSLLDFLGHSPDLLRDFDSSFTKDTSRLFVPYISFNASWRCTVETDDATVAVNAAKYQISLRLLAAACGVHSKLHLDDKIAEPIRNLLTINNHPEEILEKVIRPRLSELTWSFFRKSDNINLILLMDEFSNLEPKSENAAVVEACRQSLYSMMSNLISSRNVVILSGFTAIPDVQTISGRPVKAFELPPFNTTESRQESLPMHSEFFRLLWSTVPANAVAPEITTPEMALSEPLAVHELCKTSPGILGALVELKDEMKSSVETAISQIVFLRTLRDKRSMYWRDMHSVLQWKSFQCVASMLEVSLATQFQSLVASTSVQQVAHLPRDAVLLSSCSKHLAQIRVDPMFLARTVEDTSTSEFATFLRQLYNYSFHVTRRLANSEACNALLVQRFAKERSQTEPGRICETDGVIQLDRMTGSFFEDAVATGILFQAECRQQFLRQHRQVEQLKFTWHGFLSGAQQIGSLHKEQIKHAGDGDDYKKKSEDSNTRENQNDEKSIDETMLVWSLPDDTGGPVHLTYGGSKETKFLHDDKNNNHKNNIRAENEQQLLTKVLPQKNMSKNQAKVGQVASPRKRRSLNINEFTHGNLIGKLEMVWSLKENDIALSNNNVDELNVANANTLQRKSPGPSKIKFFGFDTSDRKYPHNGTFDTIIPSLDTLHQPARPEKNPLVDMVHHVPCAPNGDRWVEVWIDTKYSNSPPFEGDDELFPKREILEQSLNNRLLQSRHCNIDHVVHLVITSFHAPSPITEAPPDVDLGRLSSYTLYYVHPDSTAFENLVSQPIKEAIPLLELQDEKNWARKIPSATEKWKYYRAAKRDIAEHLTICDFHRWRNICFDEDCSIPLDYLDPELSKILPQQIRAVPLGCVIEALGVRPFSVNTLQNQYDPNFRVKTTRSWIDRVRGTNEGGVHVRFFNKDDLLWSSSPNDHVLQRIMSQVTIGHLMHDDTAFWTRLFELDKENQKARAKREEKKRKVSESEKKTTKKQKKHEKEAKKIAKKEHAFLSETLWKATALELPSLSGKIPDTLEFSVEKALAKLKPLGIKEPEKIKAINAKTK